MSLGARYWRFSRRADQIAQAFRHASELPVDPACLRAHLLARENATIQLQDQWSSFCRDVVLMSWRGNVSTLAGRTLLARRGSSSESAALSALRSTFTGRLKKPRNWEPKWFDPAETIDAARRLGVPNFAEIAAGVGITPSPLDELRAVRNYFAHRGSLSSSRLAPFLKVPVNSAMAHRHLTSLTLGGATTFERWATELDAMARVAVA